MNSELLALSFQRIFYVIFLRMNPKFFASRDLKFFRDSRFMSNFFFASSSLRLMTHSTDTQHVDGEVRNIGSNPEPLILDCHETYRWLLHTVPETSSYSGWSLREFQYSSALNGKLWTMSSAEKPKTALNSADSFLILYSTALFSVKNFRFAQRLYNSCSQNQRW